MKFLYGLACNSIYLRPAHRYDDFKLIKKMKFLYGLVTPFICARRSVMMILNLF